MLEEVGVVDGCVVAVLDCRVSRCDADVDLVVAVPTNTAGTKLQALTSHLKEVIDSKEISAF